MKRQEQNSMVHILIGIAMVFFMFSVVVLYTENAYAVSIGKGSNASINIFDDGELIVDRGNNKTPDIEVRNLFNDTSNIYFYVNFTNATGGSMQAIGGSVCTIEFQTEATSTVGPFNMANNATTDLFEYNKSFPRNGTFAWNVSCVNTNAGVGPAPATDTFRIFGPGCTTPSTTTLPNSITNNTILCGGGTFNILPNVGTTVFRIDNNNITLDCNGTIIRGENAQSAINLNRFNGTVIKNCVFENYTDGVVRPDGGSFQNILLYNNTFANLTASAVNISDITNVTLRTNNFTNISIVALFGVNITNFNISYNRFCQNGRQLENVSGGTTVDNNTLCVTLVSPLNNTDQRDRNFTFNIPTLGC